MEDQSRAKNKDMATAKEASNKETIGGGRLSRGFPGKKPKEEAKPEEKAAE